jgi:NAD(P)-dependent dehydrogenase (short-subunit alcohol dehydrogenase family)
LNSETKVAVVVGVGPGLGRALAVRFARGGFALALVARRDESLRPVQTEIEGLGSLVRSYVGDASDEASIRATFARVSASLAD